MLARRLVRHSFSEGGSLGEGGSIARRRPPGRNCRRARRAAAGPIVIAKWILPHRGADFAAGKRKMIAFSAMQFPRTLHFWQSFPQSSFASFPPVKSFDCGLPRCVLCAIRREGGLLVVAPARSRPPFFRPFRPFSSLPQIHRHRHERNQSKTHSILIFFNSISKGLPTDPQDPTHCASASCNKIGRRRH